MTLPISVTNITGLCIIDRGFSLTSAWMAPWRTNECSGTVCRGARRLGWRHHLPVCDVDRLVGQVSHVTYVRTALPVHQEVLNDWP
jgi:hypothetical protein